MAKVGRPKNPPTPKKLLKEVLPVEEIFNDEESTLYQKYVEVYLSDFDGDDLTASDSDDIFDLAKNKVLEFRLLKSSKNDPDRQLDIAAAIEKLGKKNEKIKENLASRRKDRINPNELKGFSIVDLAVAFDMDARNERLSKINKLRREEKELLDQRKGYIGNMDDAYETSQENDR